MIPSPTTRSLRQHGFVWLLRAGWGVIVGVSSSACQPTVEAPSRTEVAATSPAPEPLTGPPDVSLIRFACAGFDAAVAADAPPDRLLSHTAKHAVELGGSRVELATRRWALLPPQGLLEEIDRYERTGANPQECAGLRLHLERLAIISSSH
jgi:hypothetical protein